MYIDLVSFFGQDLTSTAGVAASFVGTANYMSPERALGKDWGMQFRVCQNCSERNLLLLSRGAEWPNKVWAGLLLQALLRILADTACRIFFPKGHTKCSACVFAARSDAGSQGSKQVG